MAEVRLRPRARSDIEGVWNYTVRTWGAEQAQRYIATLRDVCAALAENPSLGKSRDELHEGLRVYPSGKHLVFYLATDEGVDVIRVLHESMDSDRHLT